MEEESRGDLAGGSRFEVAAGRLSPRAARTFYNVADAWIPPGAGGQPGGGDVDLVPAVERRLRSPSERRSLERVLLWLEWEPRLRLRSLSGFSWLPRDTRRELLARWQRSPIALRRRLVARLQSLVEGAWQQGPQSREGA